MPGQYESAGLDMNRLGAAFGYRETGDPFAGEAGLPHPRTGQCAPLAAGGLGRLIGRLLGRVLGRALHPRRPTSA